MGRKARDTKTRWAAGARGIPSVYGRVFSRNEFADPTVVVVLDRFKNHIREWLRSAAYPWAPARAWSYTVSMIGG
jgi:hypothetical protein